MSGAPALGFRFSDVGCVVLVFEFRIQVLGYELSLGFRFEGRFLNFKFRIQGLGLSGFGISGFGFRV